MGLREDAEAARLAGIAQREREKAQKECEVAEKLRAKRAAELDEALDAAMYIGIEPVDEHVWITDPPIAKGYNPETYLHLRSEDGIWLRYSSYTSYNRSRKEYRFAVVEKCPHCDRWFWDHWVTTLEGIGQQLALGMRRTLAKHVIDAHDGI